MSTQHEKKKLIPALHLTLLYVKSGSTCENWKLISPFMTEIVASQRRTSRDAGLVTRYTTPLISACLKPLQIISQLNILTINLQIELVVVMLLLSPMVARISDNGLSDWYGEYGDMHLPSLHRGLLDAGHI